MDKQLLEQEAEKLYPSVSPGDLIHQITESHYINKLRVVYIAGATSSSTVKELINLLEDIDSFLCHMEDFTHGEDGKQVTFLRGKIQQQLKSRK